MERNCGENPNPYLPEYDKDIEESYQYDPCEYNRPIWGGIPNSLNMSSFSEQDLDRDFDSDLYLTQRNLKNRQHLIGNAGRYTHHHDLGTSRDELRTYISDETESRRIIGQFMIQPNQFLDTEKNLLYGGNPKQYTQGWQRIPGMFQSVDDFFGFDKNEEDDYINWGTVQRK